ncbi:MAG TPA: hypoxanthine phosphoribosyltransferase [Candidatus Methylomirabilis sp.]|jgi:hypoxanthine phosphoribosyltransferase|nr:hypoxanthine phosphoribosyltransferase [Candidatus Methylomirabilis sp.]
MTGDPESIGEILFPAETIQARVRELGQTISADYAGKDLVLVTILRGGIFFLVDLVRAISIPVAIDLMAISSYGPGAEKRGAVRILKDLEEPIGGRHVLVVEDVIDTGLTLSYLLRHLAPRDPASLKVCTLLDKPARRIAKLPITYRGFECPDAFVVGYGLDYQQHYRNLPYLALLRTGSR